MNKAVFFDRDGVLTKTLFNKKYNEYLPPHNIDELEIYDDVIQSVSDIINSGYLAFVVSNQPDYAKGKTSLENLHSVIRSFSELLESNGVLIKEYYYCFHHPEGIVPEYSLKCRCRKPETLFIEKAFEKYNISASDSFFIGDRDSDILCGYRMGIKTIYLNRNRIPLINFTVKPDFVFNSLSESADFIKSS